MSDLTDLNPLSPTGTDPVSDGDNELRALKNALVGDGTALQGSFTPTFTGQYTGTAAELNAVNTAIQPTDDLDALNDVTYSPDPPAVGDHLVYGAGGWANETPAAPAPSPGSARYAGYAGKVTDQPYFTTEVSNTIPAGLAVLKNDGTGGFGWTLTAATDVLVTLNFTADFLVTVSSSGSGPNSVRNYLGVGLNTVGSSLDRSAGRAMGYLGIKPSSEYMGLGAGCSITLAATDYLTVSFDEVTTSFDPSWATSVIQDANLNLSVQAA
tara:strand:+ start:1437 stop:2240 length:804 start_codon:yes stop_codon:yes gene_type:complete